jgi:16S rRNA processing protein RimM
MTLDTRIAIDDKVPMNSDSLVILGVCNKPHGIRGGFSFLLENSQDSVLSKGMRVYLFPKTPASSIDKDGEEFIIEKINFGNKTIAYLKGISDRNIVEAMLPFEIKLPREEFPETQDDEYYISDLIGLEVYEHGSNELIGKVSKYYDNSVQTILTIRGKNGSFDIPFVENFVPEVDLEDGKIWVVVPRMI